jgi:hypothetical protein
MLSAPDGTTFTVHMRDNATYCVEILPASGGMPKMADGFKTKAEAEQWIYDRITGEDTDAFDQLPEFAGNRTTPLNPS